MQLLLYTFQGHREGGSETPLEDFSIDLNMIGVSGRRQSL